MRAILNADRDTRFQYGEGSPRCSQGSDMKLAGFLLLLAGWTIVAAALLLLPPTAMRVSFVLAGVAVEALGLVLAVRSHRVLDVERG